MASRWRLLELTPPFCSWLASSIRWYSCDDLRSPQLYHLISSCVSYFHFYITCFACNSLHALHATPYMLCITFRNWKDKRVGLTLNVRLMTRVLTRVIASTVRSETHTQQMESRRARYSLNRKVYMHAYARIMHTRYARYTCIVCIMHALRAFHVLCMHFDAFVMLYTCFTCFTRV